MRFVPFRILTLILATILSLGLWFILIFILKNSNIDLLKTIAVLISHLNYFGWLTFAVICFIQSFALFKLFRSKLIQREIQNNGKIIGMYFFLLGMLIGFVGIAPIVLLNQNKIEWNPFNWWFSATFIAMNVCGFISVLVFGYLYEQVSKDKG